MDSARFLSERFREYYKAHAVDAPPEVGQREFGYGEYGRKISQRHLAFSSKEELNRFLREKVPFYISYSAAYYSKP